MLVDVAAVAAAAVAGRWEVRDLCDERGDPDGGDAACGINVGNASASESM